MKNERGVRREREKRKTFNMRWTPILQVVYSIYKTFMTGVLVFIINYTNLFITQFNLEDSGTPILQVVYSIYETFMTGVLVFIINYTIYCE